jgi:hypothetical protein
MIPLPWVRATDGTEEFIPLRSSVRGGGWIIRVIGVGTGLFAAIMERDGEKHSRGGFATAGAAEAWCERTFMFATENGNE